jgi:hypothetical protein
VTNDRGSSDQSVNDWSFHVESKVGFEVHIMTCMIRFPAHFLGQFRTPRHDQDIQKRKIVISLNFQCEYDGRSEAVDVVKKLLKSFWFIWPNHENVDVAEPFIGFVVCCIQRYFFKVFHKCITTGGSEFPITVSSFWKLKTQWNYWTCV